MFMPINVFSEDCKVEKIGNKFIGSGGFDNRTPVISEFHFKNGMIIKCTTFNYETFDCKIIPYDLGFSGKKFSGHEIKEIKSQMYTDAIQLCRNNDGLMRK